MTAQSLRVRLLLGAAAAIFVALAASWFAMKLLFERHIERRVADDLRRNALQLVANLTVDPAGKPVVGHTPADSRFIEPAGGLYWELSTEHDLLRSPSLGDERLPRAAGAAGGGWTRSKVAGPFDQQILLIQRLIRLDQGSAPVLVQLAHDEASVDQAAAEFGRELALWLLLLWSILAGAAWVQVQLGLRPLERVRRELDHLRDSPAKRLEEEHPPEIEPLTTAINALAAAREKDLQLARQGAADLAHGLKTPLAALSAQSRRAREAGAIEAADGLDRAIAAARSAVESELARARAATIRQRSSGAGSAAMPVIERIIGVIERTDFGADRVFEVDVPAAFVAPLEAGDLAELMGALIENAARFARRRVRVFATATPAGLHVEDDGPGLATAGAEEVLARGRRLDEAGPGHGFGLSIARELAEAAGGGLSMQKAALGGLRVTFHWPFSG